MTIFEKKEKELKKLGFTFERTDFKRPWGGFFVINETEVRLFIKLFFQNQNDKDLIGDRKVSPKILIVAPQKRLSWQYHFRRSEVWKVIEGKVGVVRSDTDEEQPLKEYLTGDIITLKRGERHRLVGLEDYGVVAEIWQHTDAAHPSDENDIVRIQDDFGRKE